MSRQRHGLLHKLSSGSQDQSLSLENVDAAWKVTPPPLRQKLWFLKITTSIKFLPITPPDGKFKSGWSLNFLLESVHNSSFWPKDFISILLVGRIPIVKIVITLHYFQTTTYFITIDRQIYWYLRKDLHPVRISWEMFMNFKHWGGTMDYSQLGLETSCWICIPTWTKLIFFLAKRSQELAFW